MKYQYNQVAEVMERNGGFATLGFLYKSVDVRDWKTKTPYKSINRIVQDDRFFFRIKPGLWALKSHKEKILKQFNILDESDQNLREFNHSYYQGLIVEIGNLRGFKTFIPNQDKNRLFLNRKLSQVASLKNIYEFTYTQIVKRASTVDVIWFNERKMPNYFFEVELTTDMYNSFIKFGELKDFYAEFYIVSDLARKREYESKLESNVFQHIRSRIKFMNFDELSKFHTTSHKYFKTNLFA